MNEPEKPNRTSRCGICKYLGDIEYYGEAMGKSYGGIPAAFGRLSLVGSPLLEHNEYTSARYRLLKQCPECGTFYRYSYDYEFMGVGFEDDYTLERLPDEIGIKKAKALLNALLEENGDVDEGVWKKIYKSTFKFEFDVE